MFRLWISIPATAVLIAMSAAAAGSVREAGGENNITKIVEVDGFECSVRGTNETSLIKYTRANYAKLRDKTECRPLRWTSTSLNCDDTRKADDVTCNKTALRQTVLTGTQSCRLAALVRSVSRPGKQYDYVEACGRRDGRRLISASDTPCDADSENDLGNCHIGAYGDCTYNWWFSGVVNEGGYDTQLHYHLHRGHDNIREWFGRTLGKPGRFTVLPWPVPPKPPCTAWQRSGFTAEDHSVYEGNVIEGCGSRIPGVHIRGTFSGVLVHELNRTPTDSIGDCHFVDQGQVPGELKRTWRAECDGVKELNVVVAGYDCLGDQTGYGTDVRTGWEFET